MRKIVYPVLSFGLMLLSFISFSQQPVCGFDILNKELSKNSDYVQRLAVTENNIQREVDRVVQNRMLFQNLNVLPGPAYEIPVVVHIIEPSGNPVGWVNPNNVQIQQAIERLNADFAAAAGSNNVGASTPIRFTLAKRTQGCVATNGIVRVSGSGVPNYDAYGVKLPGSDATITGADNNAIRSLSFWPSNMVYNIWVVWKIAANTAPGTFVAGYANLPTGDESMPYYPFYTKEGMIIIASQLVKEESTTLTHELGHAFGLYHTFEDGSETVCPPIDNCSTTGDLVCDTDPVKNLLSVVCPDDNAPNPCNNNNPYNAAQKNIMGYGSCLDRFTAGQSDRMLATLNVARAGLKTSVASLPPPAVLVKDNTTQIPQAISHSQNLGHMGPANVTIGDLNYQSYGYTNDNYQYYLDNSCNFGTVLSTTTNQTITVTTDNINRQIAKVWIDFNNNGIFEPEEQVMNSATPANQTTPFYTHTATINSTQLFSATTVKNTLLRMRVMADFVVINGTSQLNDFGPGSQLQYGQTEDFWVSIDNALSVDFGIVSAKTKNDKLFLDWNTITETNNDHFFVEASFDGEHFARVAKVDSKAVNGTSVSEINYSISIDRSGTVISLSAVFAMALFTLFNCRKSRKWALVFLIAGTGIFIACRKTGDTDVDRNNPAIQYIRIAQVDKDGTTTLSKVVKVVAE